MNRYIITGASGHIGNNLVRFILDTEPDAKVIALTRRNVGKELENLDIEQVIGDINDIHYLESNIKPNDIVIHSAGFIDLTNKRKEESYNINYLATKNLCDVCERVHVKKFVCIGSVDAIDRAKGQDIISEPQKYVPEKIKDIYGKTKAMATQYVLDKMNENITFNACIILPSAVIGVHDYKPSAIGKVVLNCIKGKAELGIKGGYNFVDVLDVCKAIYTASHNDAKGQYIVSGHNVSVKELYNIVNKCIGVVKKPIILPMWLAYLSMPFVKVLNPVTIKSLRQSHNCDYARAKRDLGYEPRSFDETVKSVVDWFRDNISMFEK